jgi:hypothetical protein
MRPASFANITSLSRPAVRSLAGIGWAKVQPGLIFPLRNEARTKRHLGWIMTFGN